MEFTAPSALLHQHIVHLKGIVKHSTTMPVLENIQFQLQDGMLTITASDLSTTVSTTIPVEAKRNGTALAPATKLLNMLRVLPKQHITISVDKSFRLKLITQEGVYELSGYDPTQFPAPITLADPQYYSIPVSILLRGIQRTLWATGNDSLRPIMHGVCFELNTTDLTMVATDAHRLARYTNTTIANSKPTSFVVDRKPLDILSRLLCIASGDVHIHINSTNARFTFGSTVLTCRFIDGKFPNWRSVVPAAPDKHITVQRMLLLSAMRRLLVIGASIPEVRFNAQGGTVNLTTENLDTLDSATERLLCEYSGEQITIGFNTRFVLDICRRFPGRSMRISMTASNRAATFIDPDEQADESTMALCMPKMLMN